MSVNNQDFYDELINSLSKMGHIRPEEFPNIDLYMDQVTTFMSEHFMNEKSAPDDKILTKTMINNYAKDNLLPPPVKKKYSKDHMIVLLFIYYLKNILSINDIQSIMNPLTESFFGTDKKSEEINMSDIYSHVYDIAKSGLDNISDDIRKKIQSSEESFTDITNPEHKDFLQYFSLMCMLSYDIYLKKQVLGMMVDKLKTDEDIKKEAEKKTEKKAEKKADKKAEKKAEKKTEKKAEK